MEGNVKIVINRCFGGYALSKEAYEHMGMEWDGFGFAFESDRANPKLVECVENLGSDVASGACACLKVVSVPNEIPWYIDDYDGMETVEEEHQCWY